ncbi:unnamed protein product [Strongylus vulgaris]|uniref:Uncharacterized protein n=1 Tax=Strongylus vulgaris TaxID=40348 RepID=A0A3P7JK34_STRVU|nr:unnamed protein product [Strongylus vulgaris]
MNRVLEIDAILHRLISVDETNLLVNSDWNEVADDIVRKLNMVRAQCYRPLSPRSSECSPRPSTSPRPLDLTPPASTLSSAASEISELPTTCADMSYQSAAHAFNREIFSRCVQIVEAAEKQGHIDMYAELPTTCADVSYQSAAHAFNREIFSRCVQIVEAAEKQGHIDMQMISLAHHSYIAMVHEADKTEDAIKLATWWDKFLESVEKGRTNTELLEILEMRCTALESLRNLDHANRYTVAEKLLETLIRSYRISCIVNRRFHTRTLRRLEKIVEWLDDVEHGDDRDVTDVEKLFEEALDEAHIDRHRYEVETEMTLRERRDPNYTTCCEMLRALSSRTLGSTMTPTVNAILSKPIAPHSKNENWSLSSNSDNEEIACSPCEDVVIRF